MEGWGSRCLQFTTSKPTNQICKAFSHTQNFSAVDALLIIIHILKQSTRYKASQQSSLTHLDRRLISSIGKHAHSEELKGLKPSCVLTAWICHLCCLCASVHMHAHICLNVNNKAGSDFNKTKCTFHNIIWDLIILDHITAVFAIQVICQKRVISS